METTIKKPFEIGDTVVWDATKNYLHGIHKGRISNIVEENKVYKVHVDFGQGLHEWFTSDGRWAVEHEPSLTNAEPCWEAVISEGRLSATCPGHTLKVVIRSVDVGISVAIFDGDVWKCDMAYPYKENQ